MDIYLTSKQGERIRFPMLPERISVNIASRFQSYDIIDIGDVKLPKGEMLTSISWEGMFPGAAQRNAPYLRGSWKSPISLYNAVERLRLSQEKATLLITGTPINRDVYINEFTPNPEGADVHLSYTISFYEAKDLAISVENTAVGTGNKTEGTKRPAKGAGKTYTVKAGDSLWAIAETMGLGGANYGKLYEANKGVIDPRNQQYSMPRYTIYPGQVLTIP